MATETKQCQVHGEWFCMPPQYIFSLTLVTTPIFVQVSTLSLHNPNVLGETNSTSNYEMWHIARTKKISGWHNFLTMQKENSFNWANEEIWEAVASLLCEKGYNFVCPETYTIWYNIHH